MKYRVEFVQYWPYDVEAEDEDKAFDEAYEEFRADMRSPVAYTIYDDYNVIELEEDEDE